MMFGRFDLAYDMITKDELPAGPWWHTDDTEMAISIVEVLRLLGTVHEDALARQFMWRYEREPDRGYGSGARQQLRMMTTPASSVAPARPIRPRALLGRKPVQP
ncbi:MAG: ADP-ribosylglycohydrolase family protein [Verrucomicrobia bacterium]|nr:ADP-ribosylglycohydrolase family protein [Verrucomicrobiota bacterium]